MKTLVLMMLLTLILSGCRDGANIGLNHTEKTYSPVFVYLPDGHIDVERSYCIVSSQHFSITGHKFLNAKTRQKISICDRAIGYKGSAYHDFFNRTAHEIRKGAGFQVGKFNETSSSEAASETAEQYDFGKINREGHKAHR